MNNSIKNIILTLLIFCIGLPPLFLEKVETVLGEDAPSIAFQASFQRDFYYPGEIAEINLELENGGAESVQLSFTSSQIYDLEITGPNSYFWRWSQGKFFLTVINSITLAPGEKKVFSEYWTIPQGASPGKYFLKARITSSDFPLEGSSSVEVREGGKWEEVFLQDDSGDVILISTFKEDFLKSLRDSQKDQETWVSGKVIRTENPPWNFSFLPDSLTLSPSQPAQVVPGLWELQENLDRWTGVPTVSLRLKPLSWLEEVPFSDLQGHWAKPPILALFKFGIVNGYPDGTFRPDGLLTRAEFAKMVVLALKLSLVQFPTPSYSDVPRDHWGYLYIETASRAGLFMGFPGGTFHPEEFVTREQILTVIARNAGWIVDPPENPTFPDLEKDYWAFPYVEQAIKEGFMEKEDKRLTGDLWGPGTPATRGQAALLLSRLYFLFEKRADKIIIQADHGGGLVPIEALRQHVVGFTLYGDGTYITERNGFVRTGKLPFWRVLDLITFFSSFGFFQMKDFYEPEPKVYDAPSTYIRVESAKVKKTVSEYAWGAPGEFRFLYTFLKRNDFGPTEEFVPQRSILFVSLLGPLENLNQDQRARIVQLPEEFEKGIPPLKELEKKPEGFELKPELYSLIAGLLGNNGRVIFALQDNLVYSLTVKIFLPYQE
ncbi:MAG: S-layer homology domain-containing protein [Caldiserica bacterium]|nr:S-layer homology domain-containing protein [Caldisericota bacterium]MDH7562508.1 S-layer homology domain-containing protein [Caldisericota bacterium]